MKFGFIAKHRGHGRCAGCVTRWRSPVRVLRLVDASAESAPA